MRRKHGFRRFRPGFNGRRFRTSSKRGRRRLNHYRGLSRHAKRQYVLVNRGGVRF